MIGEKLREARQGQQLSLVEVASKAKISAATLSRIENEKQALAMDMLFVLARVLDVSPESLVAKNGNGRVSQDEADLAEQISSLSPRERTRLWRDLATSRSVAARSRQVQSRDVGTRVEELLAQVDFLRQEIESVSRRLKKK